MGILYLEQKYYKWLREVRGECTNKDIMIYIIQIIIIFIQSAIIII